MHKPVICDVCGRLFNSRHLSSHKRLEHPQKRRPATPTGQKEAIQEIFSLYDHLSPRGKKKVLARLTAPDAEGE